MTDQTLDVILNALTASGYYVTGPDEWGNTYARAQRNKPPTRQTTVNATIITDLDEHDDIIGIELLWPNNPHATEP